MGKSQHQSSLICKQRLNDLVIRLCSIARNALDRQVSRRDGVLLVVPHPPYSFKQHRPVCWVLEATNRTSELLVRLTWFSERVPRESRRWKMAFCRPEVVIGISTVAALVPEKSSMVIALAAL